MFIIECYRKSSKWINIPRKVPTLPPWLKTANSKIDREPKQVTFAEKLITNEESLDRSMIERIKHNLEYNDDRYTFSILM